MVIQEYYLTRSDGVVLIRSYSDQGFYIQNPQGIKYIEAIDPQHLNRTYIETDEVIPINPSISFDEENQDFTAEDALNIILGRDTND